MIDHSIDVKEQIDEKLVNNYITEEEYYYLINEIENITNKCMKELKMNTRLDEKLSIINKNIVKTLQRRTK